MPEGFASPTKRIRATLIEKELSSAFLSTMEDQNDSICLEGSVLHAEKLSSFDFSGAYIVNSAFKGDFSSANFKDADIQGDFTEAMLAGADLRAESLQGSNFSGADCTGCDFGEALMEDVQLKRTILRGANLQNVVGLRKKAFLEAEVDASTQAPMEFRDMTEDLRRWERIVSSGGDIDPLDKQVYLEETGRQLTSKSHPHS